MSMLHLAESTRYFMFTGNADMRKSFFGLAALVINVMGYDVVKGDVFVFINKRRDSIKLLRYEKDGFAIFYKQLQGGTFEKPKSDDETSLLVTDTELIAILKGVPLGKIKFRRRKRQ